MLERGDMQGLLLSGYRSSPLSRYWLVRFEGSGAREWLGRLLSRITSGARDERTRTARLNIAFTATGLAALGLPEAALATFAPEFRQGMAHAERSLVLGDRGESAPARWEFGHDVEHRVDALLMQYAASEAELDEGSAELEDELERFGLSAREEDAHLPSDGREPFGFAFSVSNPRLRAWPRLRQRNPYDPHVPAGEFVLGYLNASRRFPASPTAPIRRGTRPLPRLTLGRRSMNWGENGTYLVLRKLAQDVEGFRRFTAREGGAIFPGDPAAAERFASLLVGRTPDGTPLAGVAGDERAAADPNRFGYREDGRMATRCPLGAHVRRANPRDGLDGSARESLAEVRAHRLIRRGRVFGRAGDAERGLLFVALCADIRGQFEFVQESWLNAPSAAGLTHERDPLVGSGPELPSAGGRETFSLQDQAVRRRVPLDRFVTVRGGAYL
ncbi:MAG TPA: hypothetical protein VGQ57_11840, partial [Polyangiaceae bacterium]|nr:hypothetical protein [Polyangiaceae bacterium]